MDYLPHDDFYDILSDTSSTGFDDRISPHSYPQLNENYFTDPELRFLEVLPKNFSYEDSSISYLCEICRKNFIKIEENPDSTSKRRKRTENQLIISSMKICEDCRKLDLEELKKISGLSNYKRAIKREHAKNRIKEEEGVKNTKDNQEKQIDENGDLNDAEKKRLKQIIRNRISAQQSRDRKKSYIQEMEQENLLLKQQANNFKHKIQQLTQENLYLKNQLTQIHLGGSNYGSYKVATLGLATLLSVFVLFNSLTETSNSLQARKLTTEFDLNNYKNSDGISLQKVSEDIIGEIQKEVTSLPIEPINSIVKYRKQRVDIINEPPFLRPNDPCGQKIESSGLTTLFCPSVQAYWENGSEQNELKHLQIIIPLESLPVVEHTVADTNGQKYMLEIICTVTDVSVLPIS